MANSPDVSIYNRRQAQSSRVFLPSNDEVIERQYGYQERSSFLPTVDCLQSKFATVLFSYPSYRNQVEDIYFNVPKRRLEESQIFQDMFHLPSPGDDIEEGRDDAHPISLDGIKAGDFPAFLNAL